MNDKEMCLVFARNLNRLMSRDGIKQTDIVSRLKVSKAAVSDWCAGNNIPRTNALAMLLELFKCSLSDLMADTSGEKIGDPIGGVITFPVLASVKAGYNGVAFEEATSERISIPSGMLRGYPESECRVFRVSGDSMYPKFLDGDLVIVHIQDIVENGKAAVVIYNGDEGTIKRVYRGKDHVDLKPDNPEYQTKRFQGEEANSIRIFGQVIALWREE